MLRVFISRSSEDKHQSFAELEPDNRKGSNDHAKQIHTVADNSEAKNHGDVTQRELENEKERDYDTNKNRESRE